METENTILNRRIIIDCLLSFEVSFHQQLRHFSSCPNVRSGREAVQVSCCKTIKDYIKSFLNPGHSHALLITSKADQLS